MQWLPREGRDQLFPKKEGQKAMLPVRGVFHSQFKQATILPKVPAIGQKRLSGKAHAEKAGKRLSC